MKRFIYLVFLLLVTANYSNAQQKTENVQPPRKDALKVYFSSNVAEFDIDFIKTEIPVINYVRDQGDADLYIIVTSQKTGSKGSEYTYFMTGQKAFTGMIDTLRYNSHSDDTTDKTRNGLVSTLKMGLMRYISRTPLAENVKINFVSQNNDNKSVDKWNKWVVTLSAGGTINGEKSTKSSNLWGGFNIMKVTPDWKTEFSYDQGHTVKNFLTDQGNVNSVTDSKIFDALVVKSLSQHWSAGLKGFISSQSYNNLKLKYYLFPGIEYDLFPYSESKRKQVRIMYSAGSIHQSYNDTTIYNKVKEDLWGHQLDLAAEVIQKWGTLSAFVVWENYFHDWTKNYLSCSTSMNIRVAKGFQVQISGGASVIHNQLSLVKGGASYEETLLRQKELATQYSYFTNLTFIYTFGSIYNNVVNPRFDDLNRW
jgi:hypothetical protein